MRHENTHFKCIFLSTLLWAQKIMNVLALNIMSIFTYTRTLGSIVDLASEKAAIVRYQYYIDIINTLHLPYKVNENVSHRPNIYPEFYYCLYFSQTRFLSNSSHVLNCPACRWQATDFRQTTLDQWDQRSIKHNMPFIGVFTQKNIPTFTW